MTDKIFKCLDAALDTGLKEFEFWSMTLAELDRYFKSKERQQKAAEQQKASFDYILANLIGLSVARAYNSQNKMPTMAEAYPSLFDSKAAQAAKEKQRFINGLTQFAKLHNKQFEEVAKKENE